MYAQETRPPTTSQPLFGGDGFYDHGVQREEIFAMGDASNFAYTNRETLRVVPTATPVLTRPRGTERTPCIEDFRLNFTCEYVQQCQSVVAHSLPTFSIPLYLCVLCVLTYTFYNTDFFPKM